MSSRYSFSLTTFSPSGKLVQIEHALAAVNQGSTSVGIKGTFSTVFHLVFRTFVPYFPRRRRRLRRVATNGIIIATEKKLASPLMDDSSLEKVAQICGNIGMVYSGMGPDFRVLIAKARKSAQAYKRMYGQDPPTAILVKEVASVMQEYTQSGGVRPFGVSLLICGWDDHEGYMLYQVDPSGSYFAWKASAIGKNMINAKTFLEKRFREEHELHDAISDALSTLKEGFEGGLAEDNVEVGVIGGSFGNQFRKLTPAEIKDYL